MAYKISDNDVIKENKLTVFKSVIVGVHEAFAPLGPEQGTAFGYISGGQQPPSDLGPADNKIEKFSFVSDTGGTNVGQLTQARLFAAGQSSSTHGYTSGGRSPGIAIALNTVDKYPFSSDDNASDVGDLALTSQYGGGNNSTSSGYHTGGITYPGPTITTVNNIQKYTFASDATVSDAADLNTSVYKHSSQSSPTHGYTAGGDGPSPPGTDTDVIQKFTFASDANATDVGNLTSVRDFAKGGNSSLTHGYVAGGSTNLNIIEKFSFSVDGNSSDVGDLTQGRSSVTGVNSSSFGYNAGGSTFPPYVAVNTIDKFPFSSDANATDVADLDQIKNSAAGQQV
jgi:hypothetical protein